MSDPRDYDRQAAKDGQADPLVEGLNDALMTDTEPRTTRRMTFAYRTARFTLAARSPNMSRQPAQPMRAEARKDRAMEIPRVRRLGRRCQTSAQPEKVVRPVSTGISASRGSTHRPRVLSASISLRNRSASALRLNVRYCTRPSGSVSLAR